MTPICSSEKGSVSPPIEPAIKRSCDSTLLDFGVDIPLKDDTSFGRGRRKKTSEEIYRDLLLHLKCRRCKVGHPMEVVISPTEMCFVCSHCGYTSDSVPRGEFVG